MQILFTFSKERQAEVVLEKTDTFQDIEKALSTAQKMHVNAITIKTHNVIADGANIEIRHLGEDSCSLLDRNASLKNQGSSYLLDNNGTQISKIAEYVSAILINADNTSESSVNFSL